ncbi:MAG: TraR/DksA family transcriptional regulator [Gammaproteobacteria bacterium]|nr:TraR/DksA family transcriptional regulator [Gammaproteobacteria bacterium]
MQSTDKFENQLRALRADYVKRREAIHKDTWHTEEAVEKDFAEQVTQRENDDVLDALDDDAKQAVMKIDNALLRIKAGEYGICVECGNEIPQQRLDVVPYAEYCIACADKLDK